MTHTSRGDAGGREILLLERDEGLREPFRIWLAERWDVTAVADAREARERFSPSLAAIVTSDHLLLETPEALLREFADRGFANPVLVLVSRVDRPDVDGLDVRHLSKPVTRAELVGAVEALLE